MEAGPGEEKASENRRSVGNPTSETETGARERPAKRTDERPADAVRAARVRAVGGGFLGWRPFIVAPVALGQGLALAGAEVPQGQRVALAIAISTMLGLFIVEAALVRRRAVTERWLFTTLSLTAFGIALGLALSGGLASPLLVLVLAPVVVAFAAFGRRATTAWLLVGAALVVTLIGIAGQLGHLPWAPLPEPAVSWMRLFAFVGTAALTWSGVARLADAYAEAGAQLEALRLEAIVAAATRLREREQVSAKVAHELKNPLAAVKALVQLERGTRPEGERGALRLGVVLDEIDRMDGLVRDYLGFSRPLAGLALERVDAAQLMREIAAVLSARAQAGEVRVVVSGGPSELVADRARLREALFNLTDNAVLASPPRGVVELACTRSASGHRLTISDGGAGLDATVASAFAAGDSAYLTTRPGGTGLGLAIARAAIEQHGGTLSFRTRDGGGTVAVIDLPRGEVA